MVTLLKYRAYWRWGDEDEHEIEDIYSLTWGVQCNSAGGATFKCEYTDHNMEILLSSEVYIERDKVVVFGGEIIKKDVDEDNNTITIQAEDWMGRLDRIETTYVSYDTGDSWPSPAIVNLANWRPIAIEPSTIIIDLLKWCTGKSDTDNDFNVENMVISDTSVPFKFENQSLMQIFAEVAQVSGLDSNPNNPFVVFIDPDKPIHFEPCGNGSGSFDNPKRVGLTFSESIKKTVNSVQVYGISRPDLPSDDWWTEADADGWDNPGGGFMEACEEDEDRVAKGEKSTMISSTTTAVTHYFQRDGGVSGELLSSGTGTLDLSDGLNNTIPGFENLVFSFQLSGADAAKVGSIFVDLFDNTSKLASFGDLLNIAGSPVSAWNNNVEPVATATVDSGFDWSNVKIIRFTLGIRPPWSNKQNFTFHLDGLHFRYAKSSAYVQDTESISKTGLRRKIFKSLDVITHETAYNYANRLLYQLRNQSVQYNFNLLSWEKIKLNDTVTLDIKGKNLPFPVVKLAYSVDTKKENITVTIGSNDRGFGKELKDIRLKEIKTNKELTKVDFSEFKVFDYGSCRFKMNCENYCMVDCLVSKCQNKYEVLCADCETRTQIDAHEREPMTFWTECVSCETCIIGGRLVSSYRV